MNSQRLNTELITIAAIVSMSLCCAESALAGCQINVFVKNTGKYGLFVQGGDETAVKSKNGTWRRLGAGGWQVWHELPPGETRGDNYAATFSCTVSRRYRIAYLCKDGANKDQVLTDYYPSPTGWTTNSPVTVNLQHCK